MEFFHQNTGKIGDLLPIRRAITDKHEQRRILQQHQEWKTNLNQNPALRSRIEAKAVEAAKQFRELGLRDIEELGESFRNSD